MSVSFYVCIHVCLSHCVCFMPVSISLCLYLCLSVSVSTHLFVSTCNRLCIYSRMSVSAYICIYICLSVSSSFPHSLYLTCIDCNDVLPSWNDQQHVTLENMVMNVNCLAITVSTTIARMKGTASLVVSQALTLESFVTKVTLTHTINCYSGRVLSRRSEYRPNHPNSTHSSSRISNIGVLWACRLVKGTL